MKPGRNDLCPCGSGKKFKKCHLNMPSLETMAHMHSQGLSIPERIWEKMERHRRNEALRVSKFGEIRPIIHRLDYAGYRMVVVHNRLYHSKKWKFFTDFLFEFGITRFGQGWFEAQKIAAPSGQHPAWIWRKQSYKFMRKQRPLAQGVFAAVPNGALAACNNFYYDLYTVDDNGGLDDDLLERLKDREQFQGALHELFAEATCLRAGFSIIRENEKDSARRHVKFVGVHKKTGQHVLVEAKSRHRPGVIAQSGQRSASPDFRFGRLINDAISEDPHNPLAVFVDTNLPPERAARFYAAVPTDPPTLPRVMSSLLDMLRKDHGGVDPYNLLVFSNHPQHYSDDDTMAPGRQVAGIISRNARVPVYREEALVDLLKAANLYGNVPTAFPPDRNAD